MSKNSPKKSKSDPLPSGGYTNYVAFYLPSKVKKGSFIKGIDRKALVARTMSFLLRNFEGSTQSEGIGYFNGTKKVHAERVTICKSFWKEPFTEDQLWEINRFANSLAIVFNQESISTEINGVMYFFDPAWSYRKRAYATKKSKGTVFGYEDELLKMIDIPDPDEESIDKKKPAPPKWVFKKNAKSKK